MSFIDQFIEELHPVDVRLNDEKLLALRAENRPRATSESIGLTATPKDPIDAEKVQACIAAANEYLTAFLPPGPCPCCERKHGFSWGIVHGEGFCKCGYPGRAHHNVPEVGRITNAVLWYHPSEIVAKSERHNHDNP